MAERPPETAHDRRGAALRRLQSGRHVVGVAAAALILATILWELPLLFAAAAIAAIVLAAAWLPPGRSRQLSAQDSRARSIVRPDSTAKATVEALPQPAMLLDAAGVVRYANRRAAELFPATRPGDPFTLTFRWPDISEALDEARAGRTGGVEFSAPGERTSTYSMTINPVRFAGGDPDFLLVVVDDVSERLAVARMRADFVANASHELRTPLSSLTGFIETLLGPARDDPAASERFLRVMLDQARRMRRLIDDLLSLSRAEMRAHSRPTGRADLAAVVRHVGDALAPLAAEHAVQIAVDAPREPVDVTGDRDELVQLVQNLVENAIRYGASGGRVDLRLKLRPGGRQAVAVEVEDHGPGIAAEHLPRLTERFYRVDPGASREMKGTGLGLAIVKHIVTRHAGRLDVRSEPGKGAAFIVELPLPDADSL